MWLKFSDEQVKTLNRFYTNTLYFYYEPVGLSLANWRAESIWPPVQFLYEGEECCVLRDNTLVSQMEEEVHGCQE